MTFSKIYQINHPFGEVSDFIDLCFGYTKFELQQYIDIDFIWIGSPTVPSGYTFYYYYHKIDREFIDIAIPNKFDITDCQRYFKKVLALLEKFQRQKDLTNVKIELGESNIIKEGSINKQNEEVLESFPLIFQSLENYDLFNFIVKHYENDKTPSKYSHIFHFMNYHIGEFSLTKKEFLTFLEGRGIVFSKIQEPNNRYHERIQPRLVAIRELYKKE